MDMPAPAPWRNRIVGYTEESPDQLLAHPSNWRIHPSIQQEALLAVLRDKGVVQNVLANRRTGHLIDGHLRVMLALRENQPTIPVTWIDVDEQEEAIILATLDPLSAMAVADKEKLDALLREVETDNPALQAMLADLAKKGGIVPPSLGPELDESVADGVSLCVCPECGHEHAKAKDGQKREDGGNDA